MVQERIHPPPPPSTPREAPWRQIEAIIDGLNTAVGKLDLLISVITGLPPGEWPPIEFPEIIRVAPVPNKATFTTNQKVVITAGKPEQLDDLAIPDGFAVTIIAKTGNTGYIYFGKTASDCANNRRRFDGLSAGLAVSLRIKNLSEVWVDASVSDEGVSWIVEQPA